MTTLTLPATHDDTTRRRLRAEVDRSAARGRLIASIGGLLLGVSVFILGLFLIVVIDAASPLPGMARLVMLLVLLAVVFFGGLWLIARLWLQRGVQLAAAERVELAAGAADQPVVRGLTMRPWRGGDAKPDPLAEALRQRAEQRAADVATKVESHQAYPTRAMAKQGRWLWLACIGWIVMAVVFPGQLMGVFARALSPLADTAPFSLTELDPSWTPQPPKQGDDVTVAVTPEGLRPDRVDFVRVDEGGNEVERFEMTPDKAGGFDHRLSRVDRPVHFRLEANGRATRTYTIEPELRPERGSDGTGDTPVNDPRDTFSGTTQFDPDAVAERDGLGNAALAELMSQVNGLLADLEQAEADARAIDPADAEAMRRLAERLAELAARAAALGDALDAVRGELPTDLAASLAALRQALSQPASGELPGPPGVQPGGSSGGNRDADQQQQAEDWLDRAADAASEDQASIARGVGRSDTPTDSGTTSGGPGTAPVFNDPRAVGGYDEPGAHGETGPLPEAAMRQVPPGYRPHVAAYFEALARPTTNQDDAP